MEENQISEMEPKINTANKKEKRKTKRRVVLVLVFLVLALLVGYGICRGNYLETLELGEQYLSIFWQNLNGTIITFSTIFVLLFILIIATNQRIKKGLQPFFEQEKKQIPKLPNKSIAFVLSTIIGFATTKMILNGFMLFTNATSFETQDPIFGFDIGYFIFQRPFIELMVFGVLALIIGLTIYTVLYYIITFNTCFENGVDRETLKKSVLVKQLCNNILWIAIFIAGIIFMESQNAGIQKFLTLQDVNAYAIYGAGISEVTIKLWGYRILALVVIVSVYMAIRFFKKGATKKVLLSLAVVPTYLIGMLVILIGFEVMFVKPNELDKQKNYIQANINNTKQAYGINIDEINLGENETINKQTIQANSTVVNNIAIVDKDTVLKNLNTLQTSTGYYTYQTTQIANYRINGKDNLVYISPREIANADGTYNHKTYEYTHGYGAIITSSNEVDEKGNLISLQKEFSNSNTDVVSIKQPRIYFGVETNDTVVTNSNNKKEFDYPIITSKTAENAENVYEGKAGLSLNFIDRLILSMKEKDVKLAFSGNVGDNSKILINRNIIQRAKTIMPYLLYDENPYMVVNDEGRLIWVLDAYTTSNNYPYSQRTTIMKEDVLNKKEINYIRNSVKVLIDAYDGTIQFYITDRTDPIAIAYEKIYTGLFENKDQSIPQDIQEQLVYPEMLYTIQVEMLQRYHNMQTDVLYRGDDIWDVATHNIGKTLTKTGTDIKPYYTMVKTTDSDKAKLGLVLPLTPYQKQNLIAYAVGTNENGQPKLTLYKYSQDSNILGPMQIDTQLEQDERISKEIETLNVTGTKITKNMIIVPIENSLLYVEPIYQQYINEENSTPVLKKIVVASGNKVAIGNNLKEALNNLLSQYAVDIEVENTDTIEELISAIIKANTNLKQSNGNNNWEMIGKDMTKLQELLNKLEKLIEEQKAKQENTTNKTGTTNNTNSTNTVNNVINNTTK